MVVHNLLLKLQDRSTDNIARTKDLLAGMTAF